jgi:hypothetical protein
MENKNTALWDEVCITDPSAVKKITGKPYQGDSPKPYWIIRRATEVFGPCGEGWGVDVKSEGFHRMTDTDVMHTAVVTVWYMRDGKRCHVEQMGQTKACYAKKDGGFMVDEDAGKKSVTDGMVKCLSMIGFCGDIFSGLWNDSKYVEYAAEKTAERVNPPIDHLALLQAAAINGLHALKAEHARINPPGPLWAEHGKALKAIADKADKPPVRYEDEIAEKLTTPNQ